MTDMRRGQTDSRISVDRERAPLTFPCSLHGSRRGQTWRHQARAKSYRPFLPGALSGREAKLPFETLPPLDLAAADWTHEAAFVVMPPLLLLPPPDFPFAIDTPP